MNPRLVQSSYSPTPLSSRKGWEGELCRIRERMDSMQDQMVRKDQEIQTLRKKIFTVEEQNVFLKKEWEEVKPIGDDFMGHAMDVFQRCREDDLREIQYILEQLAKEPKEEDGFVLVDGHLPDSAELLKRLQLLIQNLGITDPHRFLKRLKPEEPTLVDQFDFVVMDDPGYSVGNGRPENEPESWSIRWLMDRGKCVYGDVNLLMAAAPVVAAFVTNPWVAIAIQLVRIRGLTSFFF